MKIMRSGTFAALVAVLTAFAACPASQPASADELPFANLQALQTVPDSELSEMRGKYVPPGTPAASAALNATAPRSLAFAAASPASVVAKQTTTPLGDISGSGQVTYFGLQMVSTWNVPAGGGATQGVAVGANLGIDLQHGTVSATTWSASNNGGLPAPGPNQNTVNGAPPIENNTTGVGQSIQVAGNGNTLNNGASVQIGRDVPTASAPPTTNTCGSACSANIANNAVQVAITTAQGVVQQTVDANGIMQSIQVRSDLNAIQNQLGIQVQLAPSSGFDPGSLLPILQAIPPIH